MITIPLLPGLPVTPLATMDQETAAAGVHGIRRIADQIAENLANFTVKTEDREFGKHSLLHPDIGVYYLSVVDGQHAPDDVLQRHFDGWLIVCGTAGCNL